VIDIAHITLARQKKHLLEDPHSDWLHGHARPDGKLEAVPGEGVAVHVL
jgi:hypothetical protein